MQLARATAQARAAPGGPTIVRLAGAGFASPRVRRERAPTARAVVMARGWSHAQVGEV